MTITLYLHDGDDAIILTHWVLGSAYGSIVANKMCVRDSVHAGLPHILTTVAGGIIGSVFGLTSALLICTLPNPIKPVIGLSSCIGMFVATTTVLI